MRDYVSRVRDYWSDDLMGPLAWYEYVTALWYCLWNKNLYT